jgi:hypothetical protein
MGLAQPTYYPFVSHRPTAAMVRVAGPRHHRRTATPRRRRHGWRARQPGAARQEPHQDPFLPGGLWQRRLLLARTALLQPASSQLLRCRLLILLLVLAVLFVPQVHRVLHSSSAASAARR